MADVIAICGGCTNHKDVILNVRQMLLPNFLADVIAMVHDRCCCHGIMADVIALCLFVLWQMLLPCSVWQMLLPILCGRC